MCQSARTGENAGEEYQQCADHQHELEEVVDRRAVVRQRGDLLDQRQRGLRAEGPAGSSLADRNASRR